LQPLAPPLTLLLHAPLRRAAEGRLDALALFQIAMRFDYDNIVLESFVPTCDSFRIRCLCFMLLLHGPPLAGRKFLYIYIYIYIYICIYEASYERTVIKVVVLTSDELYEEPLVRRICATSTFAIATSGSIRTCTCQKHVCDCTLHVNIRSSSLATCLPTARSESLVCFYVPTARLWLYSTVNIWSNSLAAAYVPTARLR
jgi:hypothetical protein